jgi:2'-5' RNA ligase
MAHYLIEFRLHGYAKKYAKRLICEVARKFRVKGVTRKRPVPHITLFGPFTTRYEREMISEVEDIGRKYFLVPFKLKGFNYFDKKINKTIYIDINPSEKLGEIRWEIAKRLLKITRTKPVYDAKEKYSFHTTIAFRDIDRQFPKIWGHTKSKEEPDINQHLLRITILKNGRILREYDLMQKRLLSRREALNRIFWNRTITIYKDAVKESKEFIEEIEEEREIEETLWDRIKSIFGWLK